MAKDNFKIFTGLVNYYGEVVFTKTWSEEKYKYHMELDNWSGTSKTEVTKQLFEEASDIFRVELVLDIIGQCSQCYDNITEINQGEKHKDWCSDCEEFWLDE